MRKLLYILLTTTLLSSCNNWLDVQPYDRVAEDVAFRSVKGFENALNGIYIETFYRPEGHVFRYPVVRRGLQVG